MVENEQKERLRKRIMIENEIRDGANWFYWIAVLSVINTMIIMFGGNWNFIIGLGITQIIDAYGYELSVNMGNYINIAAFVLNLAIAGFFALIGFYANKKRRWSFLLGMFLYGIDGLLFLIVLDYLSIAFHLIALYFMYKGYIANIRDIADIDVENGISNDMDLIK